MNYNVPTAENSSTNYDRFQPSMGSASSNPRSTGNRSELFSIFLRCIYFSQFAERLFYIYTSRRMISPLGLSALLMADCVVLALGISRQGLSRPTLQKVCRTALLLLLQGIRLYYWNYSSPSKLNGCIGLTALFFQALLLSDMFSAKPQGRNVREASYVKVIELPRDLRECESIPSILLDHERLQEDICPIGRVPIRDPVEDPHDGNVYERASINRALHLDPRSPCTRLPLTTSELQECPEARRRIDESLLAISHAFESFFTASLNATEKLNKSLRTDIL